MSIVPQLLILKNVWMKIEVGIVMPLALNVEAAEVNAVEVVLPVGFVGMVTASEQFRNSELCRLLICAESKKS